MITYHTFDGDLKIGQHKTINCTVQLEVAVRDDDEYAEYDPNDNPDNYVDGVRVTGELSFDTSPLQWQDKHPVRKGVTGQLILRHEGDSTSFNVLLVEKTGEADIEPRKIKRYFWMFFAVGKPNFDKLEIFPKGYTGKKGMNKVFTCTDFRGIWPVGVSSVIVARDRQEARHLLDKALENAGIPQDSIPYTLAELDLTKPGALLLNTGDY